MWVSVSFRVPEQKLKRVHCEDRQHTKIIHCLIRNVVLESGSSPASGGQEYHAIHFPSYYHWCQVGTSVSA